MLLVISPAKSLDFETPAHIPVFGQPEFLEQSAMLVRQLRQLSPADIASLMDISDGLAALNFNRYAEWAPPFTPENAKQAVLAFDGDVYDGLNARSLSRDDLEFADKYVRILSGLYGMLRPLDLMQPYRLEMGTRLGNSRGKDLYAFWRDILGPGLEADMAKWKITTLVNLASEEYFKALAPSRLSCRVIKPVFEDWKSGKYRIISFFAKRARGLMTRFAVVNRLSEPEALKDFDYEGYGYVAEASDDNEWVFRRRVD